MNQKSVVVFICEHGAAKSIIAAAFFNRLASDRNLNMEAIARGTNPDPQLSPVALTGLLEDGLTPAETVPRKLSIAKMESAQRIVTFCELPEEYRNRAVIDQWEGVPPVSEDYERARDAILARLNQWLK